MKAELAKLEHGTWVAPKTAKMTVRQWCDTWLHNYSTRKKSTVAQARMHINLIVAEFGDRRLDDIKPLEVSAWLAGLKEKGYADSYISAAHQRMAQIYSDAIHNNLVARSPLSRRTSPPQGEKRTYVATTEQIWALHDALEPMYRAGLLLAAFAGLRLAEVCGLRVSDVDFLRGVVKPLRQYPDEELKTKASQTPVPIPKDLVEKLSRHVEQFSTEWIMCNQAGRQMGPWQLEVAFRAARSQVDGLPEGFRFHDLRHYYASFLIHYGLDIKTVQTRLRHASAKTTLDTYGHIFPDQDETTRDAIGSAMSTRSQNLAANSPPVEATVTRLP